MKTFNQKYHHIRGIFIILYFYGYNCNFLFCSHTSADDRDTDNNTKATKDTQSKSLDDTIEVHASMNESNVRCQHIPTNGDILNTAGKKMVNILSSQGQ